MKTLLAAGCVSLVVLLAPASADALDLGTHFIAASPNLERVLFETRDSLLPKDDDEHCSDFYLHDGGELKLIPGGSDEDRTCRREPPILTSDDLSVIVVQPRVDLLPRDDDGQRDVYIWQNDSLSMMLPDSEMSMKLRRVSGDGTAVLIDTQEALSPEDSDDGLDLYRWQNDESTLITLGPSTRRDARGDFALSRDGSVVFFNAYAALLPEDQDEGCDRSACQDLYRWENGGLALLSTGPSDAGALGAHFQKTSENGELAYFGTEEGLTPDDTNGRIDIYRWLRGSLERVTPDPLGPDTSDLFRFISVTFPDGDESDFAADTEFQYLPEDEDEATDVYAITAEGIELASSTPTETPGIDGSDSFTEYVTDGMERIIFTNQGSLVPDDKNQIDDLYSWTAETGEVELVSGGKNHDWGSTGFQGVDQTGNLVVFDTNHGLVPQDDDRESSDPYVRDLTAGTLTLLGPGTEFDPRAEVITEAVHRNAESVVVRSYYPLAPEDDRLASDIYLLELGQDPKLLSDAP